MNLLEFFTMKRPVSNWAQWISASAPIVALFSLVIAFSAYKATRESNAKNRTRDAYTKLYDKDAEIWITVSKTAWIHELIFDDPSGEKYKTQTIDPEKENQAECIFQILADLFEYYFLIKEDLTGSEWDERNNCWSDYFRVTTENSYGFRQYVRRYQNEWTSMFKAEFNKVISDSRVPKPSLPAEDDAVEEPIDQSGKPERMERALGELLSVPDASSTLLKHAEKEGKDETFYQWLLRYSGPLGGLLSLIIAIYVPYWLLMKRLWVQEQIELAKILTEVNKATINNGNLRLFWDVYRTRRSLKHPKATAVSVKPETDQQGQTGDDDTPIPLVEFWTEQGNLEAKDYFLIMNFAYFKLNLFELIHNLGKGGIKSESWKGYLRHSLKYSSAMRDVATAPWKGDWYGVKFCNFIDSTLDTVFLEGVVKNLESNRPPLPNSIKEAFEESTKKCVNIQEDIKSCGTNALIAYCKEKLRKIEPKNVVNGNVNPHQPTQSLDSSEKSKLHPEDVFNLLNEVFKWIRNCPNNWERQTYMDALCVPLLDKEKHRVPEEKASGIAGVTAINPEKFID